MIKYFWILVLLALFSCQDQNMTFDIGSKYVDVRTTIRYVDTLTVKSYTVKLDSIRTSALTSAVLLPVNTTILKSGMFQRQVFSE